MQDRRPTAILADDHAIVRAGLRASIENPALVPPDGVATLAEVTNGVEAIAATRQFRPDLLFLDVSMPHAGGAEVLVEARRWSPDTRVIVFTGVTTLGKIAELIQLGVDGLFSKAGDPVALCREIPTILDGQRHIAPQFEAALSEEPRQSSVTARERQILNLIVAGQSNKEISAVLGISIKTVDRHRTSLMAKLGVHSAAQLIAYALREGLIDPRGDV